MVYPLGLSSNLFRAFFSSTNNNVKQCFQSSSYIRQWKSSFTKETFEMKRSISFAGWSRKKKRGVRPSLSVGRNGNAHSNKEANEKDSGSSFFKASESSSSSYSSSENISQSPLLRPKNQRYFSDSNNIPFSISRFFNPWNDLADVVPTEEQLYDKVESTTRTFGIVAALMGSLAAALLTVNPYDGYDANREPVRRILGSSDRRTHGVSNWRGDWSHNKDKLHRNQLESINQGSETAFSSATIDESNIAGHQLTLSQSAQQQQAPFSPMTIKRRDTIGFIEHVTFTQHVSGTSLLVSWGIPPSTLDDLYTTCCAGSFYSGVLTTVLSSIINAWLSATPTSMPGNPHYPVGGIRTFVKRHSWYIVAMPALLGISTGLAGVALFIGLDKAHGTPVSYVGLGGTVFGGLVLGMCTGRGWICTYKSLTEAVVASSKRGVAARRRC